MEYRLPGGTAHFNDLPLADAIARRPRRAPDFAAENEALRALADQLASHPQGILQKLVDAVVALTSAGSAGISILEQVDGEPEFRWRATAGVFERYRGTTMQRHASPCGLVVDRNAPVLMEVTDAPTPICEVLLVPFHSGGEPVGTVWAVSHSADRRFDGEDLRLLQSLSHFAGAAWRVTAALDEASNAQSWLEQRVTERTRELSAVQRQLADEMVELDRLHELSSRVLFQRDDRAALQEILEVVIELQGADAGDITLFEPERGELQIIAQRGLDPPFVEALKRINHQPESVPRRALARSERIVEDFESVAGPSHAPGALRGLRSIIATPLVTRGGDRLGVLTTYFRRPHQPAERELRVLDLYARHASDAIERLQAGETLLASEERFQSVVRSVQDHAIVLLDPAGVVASWNEGAQRILGYSADEVIGTSAERFNTAADAANGMLARELQTAALSGRAEDENWLVRKDGSRFWASGTTNALRRSNGQLTGYAKIFRDLTQRKATEDALREKDLRLRAALAAGQMGTWHWDIRNDRQTLDENLARLMGLPGDVRVFSLDEFLGLIFEEDRARVAEAFRRSIEKGENFDVEFRVRWPDGSVHWLKDKGDIFFRPDWQPDFLTGACVDITDRKAAEAALAASERWQRLLAASATRLLAEPNSETLMRQTLSEAAELLGLDSWFGHLASDDGGMLTMATCGGIDEALCCDLQSVNMVLPSEPGPAPQLAEWIAGIEQRFTGMVRGIGMRAVGCHALHARGKLIGMICLGSRTRDEMAPADVEVLRTIAAQLAAALARQRAEAALVDADRRKDEFLAMLGHELRNPMAPLRTAMELVRSHALDDATRERMYRMIDRQLSHLTRLVDDLLDVSRITRGKIELRREAVTLDRVIDQAIEMASGTIEQRRHRLERHAPPQPLLVDGDPTRLTQVIFNLLSNAAKYTDPGGLIEVSVGRDGEDALLQVSDNGIGMPADLVPRVFDLFTQGERMPDRAQGGLGLGLTLVRRLVEMHHGTVQARSDGLGKGSTFTVRLPLSKQPAAKPPPAEDASSPVARVQRLLVVDDNADAAEATTLLLSNLAHEVAVAHSGPEALERARALRPQLVLLDIGLPGMDGYEVARRLRAEPGLAGMLIAAVTGYGQPTDRTRSREAGFDCHLVKPVSRTELEKLVREAAVQQGAARRDSDSFA